MAEIIKNAKVEDRENREQRDETREAKLLLNCPLTKNGASPCARRRCAWWHGRLRCCAVACIPDALKEG